MDTILCSGEPVLVGRRYDCIPIYRLIPEAAVDSSLAVPTRFYLRMQGGCRGRV